MLKPLSKCLTVISFIVSSALVGAAPSGGKDLSVHVKQDGNAYTIVAEMTVAANVDEVWEVLTDFDHMAQILSSVDSSRVANRKGRPSG